MTILGGIKILWIFFGDHHKGQGTEWGIFFGLLKFQILFGMLEFPDILGGTVVVGPSLRMMRK